MPICGQTPRSAPTVRYDLKEILTYATCRGRPMCLPITKKELNLKKEELLEYMQKKNS